MSILDRVPEPCSFIYGKWFVRAQVQVQTIDIKRMSKENFRFQSRLGNSTILEIASCPIEDFSNSPVCTQRCSSLIPGIS